ncbi:SAVED domain-containing protein [uncultured Pseudoteredinibacter sp.]|uniref:SAVED domain-containing protein n=1 Tax=uncultured Pseudoteredinibacter sp. TaxID=1641701 RepID=UPI00263A25D1|nr:SAVED domain-containing protein [uncultured Pseudoteredinibacter sp.]
MKDTIKFLKSFSWKILTWLTRPVNLVMKAGIFLCLTGFGGANLASFDVIHRAADGSTTSVSIEANNNSFFIEWILTGVGIIGLLMVVGESIYIIKKRRKVLNLVIEHTALREKLGSPLINAVSRIPGGSDTLPIDLYPYYSNNVVNNPDGATSLTMHSLIDTLKSKIQQAGSREITIHYGGTPPVPLGFLAGYLLGSTYKLVTWDYDRDGSSWYQLGGYGDSNKPIIDLKDYQTNSEVALIMEISHPVSIEDVRKVAPTFPCIRVTMPSIRYDNMRSLEKLQAFQSEFRELLKRLNSDGVEKVHIFCAAQASFNFSMGRQVSRNHPKCIIYEYNRNEIIKYPWGVMINSLGSDGKIVHVNGTSKAIYS